MRIAHVFASSLTLLIAGYCHASVIGFEDLSYGPGKSFYNGAVGSTGFSSGGAFFNNDYTVDPTFGDFWSGWSYSKVVNSTTPGFGNQYASFAGGGSNGSQNYAVAFAYSPGDAYIDLPAGTITPVSLDVTNTTYTALAIRDGSDFSLPFGKNDSYVLEITGLSSSGQTINTVKVSLADYTKPTPFLLSSWETVDLTSLAGSSRLSFGLISTDIGPFGSNTPAYVAIDNLVVAVPEGNTLILLSLASVSAIVWKFSRRSM